MPGKHPITEMKVDAVFDGMLKGLASVGTHLVTASSRLALIDTGRLAGSITWAIHNRRSFPISPAKGGDGVGKPGAKNVLHVGTNVEYAAAIEYGSAAHDIKGGKGSSVFIKKVGWRFMRHVKARPAHSVLRRAVDEEKKELARMLGKRFTAEVKRGK